MKKSRHNRDQGRRGQNGQFEEKDTRCYKSGIKGTVQMSQSKEGRGKQRLARKW